MIDPMKIGIIASQFHEKIVNDMVDIIIDHCRKKRLSATKTFWVPGCMEIPFAMSTIVESKQFDAVIILGYIEKGKTKHGEVMAHQVIHHILALTLKYMIPMGLGIIGPGATVSQAIARTNKTATQAFTAMQHSIKLKKTYLKK